MSPRLPPNSAFIATLLFAFPLLSQVCTEGFELPSYPVLARQARIQGTVNVHLEIDANRGLLSLALDGPVVLDSAIEIAFSKTQLVPNCSGFADLVYLFKFQDEPAAHSYTITAPESEPITCRLYAQRRNWFRRLIHR